MAWASNEGDAERRYSSGYCQGINDMYEGRPYDEQRASSVDWIEGYYDGYKRLPKKYADDRLYKTARA